MKIVQDVLKQQFGETIYTKFAPSDRLIMAAALALFIVRRKDGWWMCTCVSMIDVDAPLSVNIALSSLEHLPDELLAEIASALLRSGMKPIVAIEEGQHKHTANIS